jgi:hypothetical protein
MQFLEIGFFAGDTSSKSRRPEAFPGSIDPADLSYPLALCEVISGGGLRLRLEGANVTKEKLAWPCLSVMRCWFACQILMCRCLKSANNFYILSLIY